MQHFTRNLLLMLALLAVCALAIVPPDKKLRKGRDLAGAVSLTYAVQLEPGVDADEAINNTIAVLKNRVDPQGLFEISFNRVGRDRIEVSMPLPGPEVKQAKAAFEQALATLAEQSITESELDAALRTPAEQRDTALQQLAQGDETTLELLRQAAHAWDELQQARADYRAAEAKRNEADAAQRALDEARRTLDEAKTAGKETEEQAKAVEAAQASAQAAEEQAPSQEELMTLLQRVGEAQDRFDNLKREILSLGVSAKELKAALELPDVTRKLRDRRTGQVVELPSPRQTALANIKAAHPDAVEQIDRVIELYHAYEQVRKGFDDPRDLKRLLRGSGVLSFRIAVTPGEASDEQRLRQELVEKGPRGVASDTMRWFEIQDISQWYNDAQQLQLLRDDPVAFFRQRNLIGAERNGVYYVLLWDTPEKRLTKLEGDWALESAFRGVDELGRPAVNFRMDPRGAGLLGRLTGANVQKPMAVLLDDKVYTAPNLLGRISTNGQIQGNFTPDDIDYLVRTLSAGSLQARLSPEPLSEVVLAPTLGADNMRRGLYAGIVSLVAVAAFMAVYYLGAGLIAVIALAANAIMILGIMSLTRAAFTLPGIAGVILTFGMAVDSNVLIYE
ncbi:MAG: hypothetical protein D6824_09110, partial [Planctomycetota bacterium]